MPDITLQNLYDGAYAEAGDYQYFASPSNPTICPEAQALNFINNSIRHHVRIAERNDCALKIAKNQITVAAEDYSSQAITMTADGGMFTVTRTVGDDEYTTAALDHDVSVLNLLTALQGICPVGPDSIELATGVYRITWTSTPRPNILALSVDATNLTGGTATITATDSERGYQREYYLDHWLIDASTDPNFRGNLFIWRTDGAYPAPIYWPAGGDYRMKESYGSYLFARWPSEEVYQYIGDGGSEVGSVNIGGHGYSDVMYQRGRAIGFYETPSQAMTLEAHYLPLVKPFATQTEELGGNLDLSFLIDHKELLEVWAAISMRQSRNLPVTPLQGKYAVLLADFMEAVAKNKPQVALTASRHYRP